MQHIVTTQQIGIGGTECQLWATGHPQAIMIQPSARHETKNDGLTREAMALARMATKGFALLTFDTIRWAETLMPWHDDAVSREAIVGTQAHRTLHTAEHVLLPWMRERYGQLPCIIGGYSLGGMFALWAACQTRCFDAVAAASPSLWIEGWDSYASTHSVTARYVYLSMGDREEHCRNQRMRLIGQRVRQQHLRLLHQLGQDGTTLCVNSGGHFGDEAERTAKAMAWCCNRV